MPHCDYSSRHPVSNVGDYGEKKLPELFMPQNDVSKMLANVLTDAQTWTQGEEFKDLHEKGSIGDRLMIATVNMLDTTILDTDSVANTNEKIAENANAFNVNGQIYIHQVNQGVSTVLQVHTSGDVSVKQKETLVQPSDTKIAEALEHVTTTINEIRQYSGLDGIRQNFDEHLQTQLHRRVSNGMRNKEAPAGKLMTATIQC